MAMEDAKRALILTQVMMMPGISTRELADVLKTPESSLDYHLRRLRKDGQLVFEQNGRNVSWFVAGQGFCPVLRRALPLMRREEARRIVSLLGATPITSTTIMQETGYSMGLVRWNVTLLAAAGLLERGMSGRGVLAQGAEPCREKAIAQERCDQWGACLMSKRLTSCPSLSAKATGPGRSSGPRRAP